MAQCNLLAREVCNNDLLRTQADQTGQADQADLLPRATYILRGPEQVAERQIDVCYEALIVNNSDEPLAVRAWICPASSGHFQAHTTELTETAPNAGGFTTLDDNGCARVQGILHQRGDQFTWHLIGAVADHAHGTWETHLRIEASCLADAARDVWVELGLPDIAVHTTVAE